MPGFRFRLNGLLKLRKHGEDAARQELAEAHRRVREAHKDVQTLVAERSKAAGEVGTGHQGHNVSAIQAGYARVHLLRQREAASREELAALSEQHEDRREEAIEAHRQRETIQQLHDRYLRRYLAELRRQEGKRTDETGTLQAARRIVGQSAEGQER